MATDAEMKSDLDRAAGEIKKGVRAEDLGAVCEQYKKIRPWILGALPLIKKIPVYGEEIAAVLTFLMGIADKLCP